MSGTCTFVVLYCSLYIPFYIHSVSGIRMIGTIFKVLVFLPVDFMLVS